MLTNKILLCILNHGLKQRIYIMCNIVFIVEYIKFNNNWSIGGEFDTEAEAMEEFEWQLKMECDKCRIRKVTSDVILEN